MKNRVAFPFFALLVLLFTACKSVILPESPEQKINEVPQLPQRESTIYLPISINLKPYLNQTEKSLPRTFTGGETNCEGVSYSYVFNRDSIEFKGKNEELYFEVDGQYSLKLNYCPQCTSLFSDQGNCVVPRVYASCGVGEPMRNVSVGYGTSMKISPNYVIQSKTTLEKFETIDPCEITVFHYDATEQLRKEVTTVLKKMEKDIDKQLASIDLKSQIQSAWSQIAAPISLGKYGFVSIHPTTVSLSDLNFVNNTAQIDLNFGLKPVFSTNPILEKPQPLPALSEHKKDKGFAVHLDIFAAYDSLSSILTSELSGKKVTLKKNEIIFDKIAIESASGKQLNIKVDFSGDKKGTLYLKGTPKFDSLQQVVSFPDLTFDLKTKNALLKSAKWLFNDKITEAIRQSATFSMKQHLNEIKKLLSAQLNKEVSKGIQLNGAVSSVTIDALYPTEKELILRVSTSGNLRLKM